MILYFRRESLFNNSDKEKLIDIDADYFKKNKNNWKQIGFHNKWTINRFECWNAIILWN